MTQWQSVVAVVVGVLALVFTHRLWLPSLLDILRGQRIEAVWADKKYSLSVAEAESVISQQHSALRDPEWGPVARLKAIPGVLAVELGPKEVRGVRTTELVYRVVVEKKRPLADIPANEVIPQTIGNIATDVVQAV